MKQLLSALVYLHDNYIVHLDIKLENIVFLEKCQNEDDKIYIKLIDFGCAKTFTPFKKKKAKISGTLSYIAPECLQGYYSEKCDIWSSGVLLYILLSGVSPFKGKDSK
jgi:calcium-dependent protein kinase